MTEFLTQVDIGNRALQHVGQELMGTAGFLENSRNARQIRACYGKLRRAELQRNVWSFAIRRAVVRPITTTTRLLAAALWSPIVTYFRGSIVIDQYGTPWISLQDANINFDPLTTTSWEQYFGPLSVSLWTSATSYFAGELVYTTPGDGTARIYLSLVNGNADNPLAGTSWSASTTYMRDQVVRFAPAWSSATTYIRGQMATVGDVAYVSAVSSNLNNPPASSPTFWVPLPAQIAEWSATTSYVIGNIVDYFGVLYYSKNVPNLNQVPPLSSGVWTAITGATSYMSKIDLNANQVPSSSAADWASGTTYAINALANGSDGVTYKSLSNGNIGHDPISSPAFWQSQGFLTPWTTVFVGGAGSINWLQIGGTEFPMGVGLSPIKLFYPIDMGPSANEGARNVFRKPANFLRMAPRDPKAGSVSLLGAPSGLAYPDWNQEGDYVVSREAQPIVLRFVADVVDVRRMHDMFCEGLGCRVGVEICEPLTQSSAKLQTIASAYKQFMAEARTVNAIETGSDEPPLDDYIECRW
jgi:hypothetical protein